MKYIQNFKAPPSDDEKINKLIHSCREQFIKIGLAINQYYDIGAKMCLAVQQQNIESEVYTQVLFDSKIYDLGGNVHSSYQYFTVPKNGYYLVLAQIVYNDIVPDTVYWARIRRGSTYMTLARVNSSFATTISVLVLDVIEATAGDTIKLYAYHIAGVDTVDLSGDASGDNTFMTIFPLNLR